MRHQGYGVKLGSKERGRLEGMFRKGKMAARHDHEYQRNGTANLFMVFAPPEGWQQLKVTDQRTAIDYAHILKEIPDKHFPNAKRSYGSWLDMAGSEPGVLSKQCLDRRIPDRTALVRETAAWVIPTAPWRLTKEPGF